ncbi:MAG: sulfite exporter TauE/SafE family protein [Candidatus Sedimenticola endophacoides]
MPELTPELTLYILAAVTLAGLVHGTLGLGFPLTATPLLALVMEMQSAILITLLPNIAVNILSIADGGGWRHSINRYWPLALYAVAGTALGTAVLLHADPAPMKLLLALLILLYLNLERIGRLDLRWITARPRLAMLLFGLSAGFAAGTANVMVPILVIFTLDPGSRRVPWYSCSTSASWSERVPSWGCSPWQGCCRGRCRPWFCRYSQPPLPHCSSAWRSDAASRATATAACCAGYCSSWHCCSVCSSSSR